MTRAFAPASKRKIPRALGTRFFIAGSRWLMRNVSSSSAPVTVTFVRDERFSCHVKRNRISYSPALGIVAVNVAFFSPRLLLPSCRYLTPMGEGCRLLVVQSP